MTILDPDRADSPTPEFAARLRSLYPSDPDLEVMLDRKLARRGDGPYRPASVAELGTAVRAMLEDILDEDFEVTGERWLTGGASKVQLRFTVERSGGPGREPRCDDYVVRMDPSETLNTTNKVREFELVSALVGTVPVPNPLWVDADARWFPEPAIVYEIAPGVTKPTTTDTGRVVGLGTNFGPELRRRLTPDFVSHLAALHTFDPDPSALTACTAPSVGTTQNAQWRLNFERRVWEEDRGEDCALMELASSWLASCPPVLDRVSVVHGDYRSGNFLFDEASGRITSWLDWEGAHLGDRHWDLAWSVQPLFGHLAEDGKTFLACGLLPVDEWLASYEQASGLTVDPGRLDWYRVFICYSMMVKTVASAYRVARLGRSHQNIVLSRLEGSRSVIELELVRLLEKVI